jgi:hypothetical protein
MFNLIIPVSTKHDLLQPEEELLALLRWIQLAIPATSRWFPVFNRYIGQVSGRIAGFGGNPTKILPSPFGGVHEIPPEDPGKDRGLFEHTGKIMALHYDRFGDFIGFDLEDLHGHHHRVKSGERRVEDVADRACRERYWVTVTISHDHHFVAMVVRDAPFS